jgi:aerobic-type carbon monoxide dehydrogenase small subunit (CoxS/CutS family)
MSIELEINGELYSVDAAPTRRLSTVLREDLGLTGTKIGCGEGACGACAVLIDGRVANSCLVLAAAMPGRSIVTIEGLSSGEPTTLQRAFVEEDALQCGFCTPGQVVAATALLAANPNPTPTEVRAGLSGNLCRCGAYPKIERAVLRAAVENAR